MICLSNRLARIEPARVTVNQAQLEMLLDHISLPMFLLKRDRSLIYANAAGHEHLDKSLFVQMQMGRVQISGDPHCTTKFEDAVRYATDSSACHAEPSFSMTLGDLRKSKASLTVMCFPDLHKESKLAAVILTAQDAEEDKVILRLQQTLDLTPSEARVAFFISAGKRPKEISCHLNVSINTVKSHLANVFAKTGCTDQAAFCVLARQLLTPIRDSLPKFKMIQKTLK